MEIKNTINNAITARNVSGVQIDPNDKNLPDMPPTRSKAIQLYFLYTEMVENEVV